jgi:predicted DNA-binding transcriptional regulator AlpA
MMNISMLNACTYIGIGETVFNERIAVGDLPPKINLAGTRRVGFDLIDLENARLRLIGQPEMSVDQAIAFRAIAAAVLLSISDDPEKYLRNAVPAALKNPVHAVNSVFGLGDQTPKTMQYRLKK